jgi:hypothetical protein
MQTTLTIDDNLWAEAAKLARVENQNQLIALALAEFIQNHAKQSQNNILELYGSGGISDDYDYKALRLDGNNHVSG